MQLVDTPLQAVTRTIQCEVAEMEFLRRKSPAVPLRAFEIMPDESARSNSISDLGLYLIFIASLLVLHCNRSAPGP